MKNILKLALVIAVLSQSVFALSQNQVDDSTYSVEVIQILTPSLKIADKLKFKPKQMDTITPLPQLDYYITSRRLVYDFTPEQINAARLKSFEPLARLKKHIIYAGFGTAVTPYAEAFYSNLRSKNIYYGAHIKHFSSKGNIPNVGYSGYSNNLVEINMSKFLKKTTFSAEALYNRDVVHFYGYNQPYIDSVYSPIDKDSTKQVLSSTGAKFNYKSDYIDSSHFNYDITLGYLYSYSLSKFNQHKVSLNADLNKNFDLFKAETTQNVGLLIKGDYYNQSFDTTKANRGVVLLNPYLKSDFDLIKIQVGLNVFVKGTVDSKVYAWPMAEVDVRIVKEVMSLYGGITNDLEYNSFFSLCNENPFVRETSDMEFTYYKYKFYAGLRGAFNSKIDYNLHASFNKVEDLALYKLDYSDILMNRFIVDYADGEILSAGASISYKDAEHISVKLSGNYYYYSLINTTPWHLPDFDVKLTAMYNIADHFVFNVDLVAEGSRLGNPNPADLNAEAVKLPWRLDANISAEYRYNDVLTVFARVNNVAALKYYDFYYYPNQRLTFLAGISYSF